MKGEADVVAISISPCSMVDVDLLLADKDRKEAGYSKDGSFQRSHHRSWGGAVRHHS